MEVVGGAVAVLLTGTAAVVCFLAVEVAACEALSRQPWTYRLSYAAFGLACVVGMYASMKGVLECLDMMLPR